MAKLIYSAIASLDYYIEDRNGLLDECQLYLVPILVGGGKPCLPSTIRRNLALISLHHFADGTVHLHYHVNT